MNSSILALVVMMIGRVHGKLENAVEFHEKVEVIQVDPGHQFEASILKVFGVRSCGGEGQFVSLRAQGCLSEEYTCQYPNDDIPRTWEVEFIPSKNTKGVGLKLVFVINEVPQIVWKDTVTQSLKAGERTIVRSEAHAGKDLTKGTRLTSQYYISRIEDNVVEVCLEADFKMV